MAVTLVWYRQDLRIAGQPALAHAAARGRVVPIYIWAPQAHGPWRPGAAQRVWLHHSLDDLGLQLKRLGTPLILRQGDAATHLLQIAEQTGADELALNRCYEPALVHQQQRVINALAEQGIATRMFESSLLYRPEDVRTSEGSHYRVFTPMWRAVMQLPEPARPGPAPTSLKAPGHLPDSESLEDLALLPQVDWAGGIRDTWTISESGAHQWLHDFAHARVAEYTKLRDRPDHEGVSGLSPYLHHGQLSPAQVWHEVRRAMPSSKHSERAESAWGFLRQLIWREFAHHLLVHEPHTPQEPLRPEFAAYPWRDNADELAKWQRGETGYPIVDAAMRQLWHTGYMHNRLRMIVASFLVKDLQLHWLEGARWFWDTLVDADLANNTLGWQWTAGCGADAAPYFRIFNPVLQGRKFDPDGHFVRHWLPQLAALSNKAIHAPWELAPDALAQHQLVLGKDYPQPMVDHHQQRDAALAGYEMVKQAKSN